MNGDLAIRGGEADLVLTGGVESMSQAGFFHQPQGALGL